MGAEYTPSQKRASAKYEATHCKKVTFKFSLKNDADILQKLDEVDNKTDYIRKLIREDLGAK